MGSVLLFARSYRALPRPLARASIRTCISIVNCSPAKEICRRRCDAFDPRGKLQTGSWECDSSDTSRWCNNRLEKESLHHPDIVWKLSTKPLMPKTQDNLMWERVYHSQSGSRELRAPVSQVSCKPRDNFQSLCKEGKLDKVLNLLLQKEHEGTVLSVSMYRCLLNICNNTKALVQAKLLLTHLAQHGLESRRSLGEHVVSTLAKCGGLKDAIQLLYRLPHRSTFGWTAVISAYTMSGQGREAIRVYQRMQEEGVQPSKYTLVTLLRACGFLYDLKQGKHFHAEAVKHKCASDLFVGTCLMDMYAKCGSIVDVQNVFDKLCNRDVVSWTVMLATYTQQGQADKALQLYEEMQVKGCSPNDRTFVSALQACGVIAEKEDSVLVGGYPTKLKALGMGKAMHIDAWRRGYDFDVFVSNTLVSMYAKCGSIMDAQNVFNASSQVDVVSWNAMLAACAEHSQGEKAVELYERMQEECVSPDARSFVSIVQSCGLLAEQEDDVLVDSHPAKVKALSMGRALHADAWRRGFDSHAFVGSALVSMYGKCRSVVNAQNVFDRLSHCDVVSWSAMVVAYIQQGKAEEGLQLYEHMQEEGMSPDVGTFVIVIQACGMQAEKEEDVIVDGFSTKAKSLEKGKAIHAHSVIKGYASDVFVGSTLISMYGKCGSLEDAANVLHSLPQRNVVSWNAMLAACAQHVQSAKAFPLYKQMKDENVSPNGITLMCVLQACSNTGDLVMCRQIHRDLVDTETDLCPLLANTLIHAYGRCASMAEAQAVFDAQRKPTLVSWNALIAGYARQGDYAVSLQYYEEMRRAGVKPDEVTFLSLLSACTHAGLVNKGVQYFESMSRDHGLTPAIEHYVCVVDLLGRGGHFSMVEDLLSRLPLQPNQAIWVCLLAACQKHGKVLLGKHAFDSAVALDPSHSAAYVLMSNIYADAGLWEYANQVMDLRQHVGAWKNPGHSWIEHAQNLHTFVVAHQNHPQEQQLNGLLGTFNLWMKENAENRTVMLL